MSVSLQKYELQDYKKVHDYIFNYKDELGRGSFSKVYKAKHIYTGQRVALKIVDLNTMKSPRLRQLLFSQIQIVKNLKHPNILNYHEVYISQKNCYIISQLCQGGDLQATLRKAEYFEQPQIQKFLRDINEGLLYLAKNKIVHRDLKTANIFLHEGCAKIADFGFSVVAQQQPFSDISIGTPLFMAPEALMGNIYSIKTDTWAFGILIYELLFGKTPFSHCTSLEELKVCVVSPNQKYLQRKPLSSKILEVLRACLKIKFSDRASIFDLQALEYFSRQFEEQFDKVLPINESKVHQISSPKMTNKFKKMKNMFVQARKQVTQNQVKRQPRTTMTKGFSALKNKTLAKQNSMHRVQKVVFSKRLNISQSKDGIQGLKRNQKNYSSTDTLPTLKSSQKRPQNENKSRTHSLKAYNKVISSPFLSEPEYINLLHYSRLLFKTITMLLQLYGNRAQMIDQMEQWLGQVLNSILRVGHDTKTQETFQMMEIVQEYLIKYGKQLKKDLIFSVSSITYEIIYNTLLAFYLLNDQHISHSTLSEPNSSQSQQSLVGSETSISSGTQTVFFELGHYLILLCKTTKILKRCYDDHNYWRMYKLDQLQAFLQYYAVFNHQTYAQFKNKYLL